MYYRKQIWVQARRSMNEQSDVHARLMARYPQVPEWWYAILFGESRLVRVPSSSLSDQSPAVIMFIFGVVCIEVYNTNMPVWGFILALIIAFIYVLPIGMIQAITNQQVGLNVITELIVGYMLPGRPIAMMMFKVCGRVNMVPLVF